MADRVRKKHALILMSCGVLVLIAVQLVLHYEGDRVASLLVGSLVLISILAIFMWARRNGVGTTRD